MESIKTKLQDMEGFAPHEQILFMNNQELDDSRLLSDYKMQGFQLTLLYLKLRPTGKYNLRF